MKEHVIIGMVVLILALSAFQSIQINSLQNAVPAPSASLSATGNIDTSGWTQDEIMNYEMHGIIPARATQGASVASAPSNGMVGGC